MGIPGVPLGLGRPNGYYSQILIFFFFHLCCSRWKKTSPQTHPRGRLSHLLSHYYPSRNLWAFMSCNGTDTFSFIFMIKSKSFHMESEYIAFVVCCNNQLEKLKQLKSLITQASVTSTLQASLRRKLLLRSWYLSPS